MLVTEPHGTNQTIYDAADINGSSNKTRNKILKDMAYQRLKN